MPTFFQFDNGHEYLAIDLLDDGLVNVWYGTAPLPKKEIPHASWAHQREFPGPSEIMVHGLILETADLRLIVDRHSLELTVTGRKNGDRLLTVFKPEMGRAGEMKSLRATCSPNLQAYGLCPQAANALSEQTNHNGHLLTAEGQEGAVGKFPVLYALDGHEFQHYAFLLDNACQTEWDFTAHNFWKMSVECGELSFFVVAGADFPDLRNQYLELTTAPESGSLTEREVPSGEVTP